MANEMDIARTVFANFIPRAEGDYVSTTIIPLGAVVKGVTSVEGDALASGTSVTFKGGGISLTGAITLAEFTGVDIHALATADGLVTTSSAPLSITTAGIHDAGDIDVYVKYFFNGNYT